MITQEKLNEIIESHGKWLRNEEGGERADLGNADLRNADLRYADLRNADLRDANLRYADLRNADLRDAYISGAGLRYAELSGVNLRNADLRNADLRDANLRYADLRNADLRDAYISGAGLSDADLRDAVYQVSRIGSRKGTTTYNATLDNVQCGCWGNWRGGTLADFIARIKSVYGENGSKPNKQYYGEYMAAIDFFIQMKKLGDTHD